MTRMPRKDPKIMDLIVVHGPNPQLVGIVDGTEDDYGDLLTDVAILLEVDMDNETQWQHFQEVAQEARDTNMTDWVNTIRKGL
jgi:aminoglycoside phosphotransferase (APT) family kinase protein